MSLGGVESINQSLGGDGVPIAVSTAPPIEPHWHQPHAAMYGIPEPYTEEPSRESQAHRLIRRMDWERLERCVANIDLEDSLTPFWTSLLVGAAFTALIGCITTPVASHLDTRAVVVMTILGCLAVFSALGAWLAHRFEKELRRSHVTHLDALKTEMQAIERYMVAREQ